MRDETMSRRPPMLALWAFIAALGAVATVLWWRILSFDSVSAPFSLPWWLLAAGFVVTTVLAANVTFQGEAHSIDLVAVPTLVGLIFCSLPGLFAAKLVGLVIVLGLGRRQRPGKFAFNV